LPILVQYLVRRAGNVGRSVGVLYGVNTLGSAVACFMAAIWLLGGLGKTGTVYVAAALNLVVGAAALLIFMKEGRQTTPAGTDWREHAHPELERPRRRVLPFGLALGVASLMGFLSLSYELLWVRAYSFMTGGQAHTFPFLLGSFLAGIALGAVAVRRFCENVTDLDDPRHDRRLAYVVFLANVIGFLILPTIAFSAFFVPNDYAIAFPQWYMTLPAVVVGAAMLGATLPLISHIAIDPTDGNAGAKLSYLYVANIIGSSAGGLLTGFYLLDWFSLATISTGLALLGLALTAALFLGPTLRGLQPGRPLAEVASAALVVVLIAPTVFDSFYERLLYKEHFSSSQRLANIIETKTGVITVGEDRVVYGHGTYDGALSTNLVDDVNGIFRAYSVGAFHAAPRDVLSASLRALVSAATSG
jgi:spermidine synthase